MGKGGGKRRRRRNASKKKRWNKMLQDKWSRQQKINMKRLIGQDPNDIKPGNMISSQLYCSPLIHLPAKDPCTMTMC